MKKYTVLSIYLIFLFLNLAAQAQNTYAFFGSYNQNRATKKGIYVYRLDTLTGKLSKITTAKVGNPSYLTLSPTGDFLYACTNTKTPGEGSISAYKFDLKNKELIFLNKQASGGENPVYITVHKNGRFLINANYNYGSIAVHPLLQNGSIGTINQNFNYTDSSVNSERQEGSHIHSAVFSPDYNQIFFQDLGADKIRIYPFISSQQNPIQDEKSIFIKTTPGSGPRHFAFHPNGKFAYCIEEMAGCVSIYSYKGNSLTEMQRIPTHDKSLIEGFESSDIHISPDGKFLYASNRGQENNIAIFSIANTGMLTSIGYQPTLGKHPRIFAIDPSGKFLIATNVKTSNVIVFKRNLETGLLTKIGKEIKIKNVSCVQIQSY